MATAAEEDLLKTTMTMMTMTMKTKEPRAGLLEENEGKDPSRYMWIKFKRISSISGLSVQNPDRQRAVPGGDMVRDLLRRAAE